TDFADFAGAPDPSPTQILPVSASSVLSDAASPTDGTVAARPFTKWYRVWERTTPADFYQEAFILPIIILVVLVHVWGTRANRRKAKAWISAHAPALTNEYAKVGYGGQLTMPTVDDPETLLKEVAANEYTTYATGRQNVAFVDVKISLFKRYNPLVRFGEAALGFFFESMPAPAERMEATAYAFDGKESQLVPQSGKAGNSTYDGFVWAIVHKDLMKGLRDDRYDLSLTSTKDHPKLPIYYTIMSESAEITDALLTPELIKAVEKCGDALEALVISDQPMDQPKKLNETAPKKRVSLSFGLPSSDDYSSTLPLFNYFLRLPDILVSTAHFRPEALRRVRATREDEIRKIRRVDEEEKAEERKIEADKAKKAERERKLKNLSADEQRKFLDKEREKDMRRSQRKKTMKA
ncbi:DUF1682 domain protein, partial [Saccharata proteae CBS 121410]